MITTAALAEIERAAADLRRHARRVSHTGGQADGDWQRVGVHYRAPESDDLLGRTAPLRTRADRAAYDAERVASVLDDFVTEARPLVARAEARQLSSLRAAGDDDDGGVAAEMRAAEQRAADRINGQVRQPRKPARKDEPAPGPGGRWWNEVLEKVQAPQEDALKATLWAFDNAVTYIGGFTGLAAAGSREALQEADQLSWEKLGGQWDKAGGGLAVGAAFYDQWAADQEDEPDMETDERIARATFSGAVVGGFSIGGALMGTAIGAPSGPGAFAGGILGGVGGTVAGKVIAEPFVDDVGDAFDETGETLTFWD